MIEWTTKQVFYRSFLRRVLSGRLADVREIPVFGHAVVIAVRELARAFAKLGPTVQEAAENMRKFQQVLDQVELRRVCSWCKTVLDEGDEGAETTHTICPSCTRAMEEQDG